MLGVLTCLVVSVVFALVRWYNITIEGGVPMYCTNCGAKIEEGYRFCTGCGAPVVQGAPANNRSELDRIADEICERYMPTQNFSNDQYSKAISEFRKRTGTSFFYARDYLYERKMGITRKEARRNQKESLRIKKQQDKEQMQDNLQKIAAMGNMISGKNKTVRCPKCGSTSISYGNKKLSLGRSAVGYGVAGPTGAVLGGLSSKKGYAVCLKCGKTWKI